MQNKPSEEKSSVAFEKAGEDAGRVGVLVELWQFLRENKKWWMIPIILLCLLLGLVVFLSGTGFAPFIYTLF